MWNTSKLLLLDEERVLVPQLRLVMNSMIGNFLPIMLQAILMCVVLADEGNGHTMTRWLVLVLLSQVTTKWVCWRSLRGPMTLGRAHRVVWLLVACQVLAGALWGSLAWLLPAQASLAQSVLVLAVVAGMVGGSVATLSSVPVFFVTFALPALATVGLQAWLHGDSVNRGLGLTCVLFALSLVAHARRSAQATRATILLRFENEALLAQLRVESLAAQHARGLADRANAAKSKVMAAASHDLRQPVHAQGLFLEVLSRTSLDAHQRELLASATAAGHASADLLGALFDFSRIEAGVIQPQCEAFAVQPLLNKIEREFAQQADAKGLHYRSRESTLVVHSDPTLVELILRNLVANAIRYTHSGGLLVACRLRGGQAWLEVWDTGAGIAPEHQEAVFLEFHQLNNPERDRLKGFGLGLAIAHGMARALAHELALRSVPRQGSVFRLALPVSKVAPRPEAAPSWPAPLPKLNARVLVLDDNEHVLAGTSQLLSSWGVRCDVADGVEQALIIARCHPPDLVISDYRLRDRHSGLDALASLRQLLGPQLPCLLVTGDTAPDFLSEAARSGFTVLHKPVSAGQLHRSMSAALGDN